jgi:cyclophilin family peptidyl-prolyl cis-trans isomerase
VHKILLYSLLILLFSSCFADNEVVKKAKLNDRNQLVTAQTLRTDSHGLSTSIALLKTVHGNLLIKFYPQKAPSTVTRILELIQKGFYDGLQFHRVVDKFVAQAGDPTGLGSGGTGARLKSEFNDVQHIRGTLAMARDNNDKDSADSQFYIALSTLPHLDGKYTVFAQVVEGLDLLGHIQQGDKILTFSLAD